MQQGLTAEQKAEMDEFDKAQNASNRQFKNYVSCIGTAHDVEVIATNEGICAGVDGQKCRLRIARKVKCHNKDNS